MNGKIGFPGGKPNGTAFSTGNFSKKREYFQRYSSFLVFTGIAGKLLYHLPYHTSAMLLGKNKRFLSRKWGRLCFSVLHAVFDVLIWTPLSVIAVRLQVSVVTKILIFREHYLSTSMLLISINFGLAGEHGTCLCSKRVSILLSLFCCVEFLTSYNADKTISERISFSLLLL